MTLAAAELASTTEPLSKAYDLAMLDLDGVVYLGAQVIDGAAEALVAAQSRGIRLAYITNNASRPARDVAAKLRAMGMPSLDDADVVTSAQAVARLMAAALPAASKVLLVGGEGLRVPLEAFGFECVAHLADGPVAVVQGFHPSVGWAQLAEASYAIQSGLPWYVSNTDLTVPTPHGIAPGNGSLVQAVRHATGAEPVVAGKPERALFDETIARVGGQRPLMVGDRLDTDIDGAISAGIDSLAVLTGVSGLRDIYRAVPGRRPSFVAADLRGLDEVHLPVEVEQETARCGASVVGLRDGATTIVSGDPRDTSTLRAAVALAWRVMDRSDTSVVPDGTLEP